jgi:hypothetical protein
MVYYNLTKSTNCEIKMIKLALLTISLMLLSACGSDTGSASDGSQGAAKYNGRFEGTLGDKSYALDVNCYSMDKEGQSTFASSLKLISEGKNADGLYVRGDELIIGDKISLSVTLVDGDISYRNSSMPSWNKSADGVAGEGELSLENNVGLTRLPIKFEVTCR